MLTYGNMNAVPTAKPKPKSKSKPKPEEQRLARAASRAMGSRVAAAREQAGISMRELGRSVGVTVGTISRLEDGKKAPDRVTAAMMLTIAKRLGVSADYLVFGSETQRREDQRAIEAALAVHDAPVEPDVFDVLTSSAPSRRPPR